MRAITNRDTQRVDFIESLHKSLKQQAAKAISDHKKFIVIASNYIKDGLEEKECIELLMIDGLSREAAESYASMVVASCEETDDGLAEYSFQYEDERGMICTSHEIGKTIRAANDDDAWTKAQEILEDIEIESEKIISVSRIE